MRCRRAKRGIRRQQARREHLRPGDILVSGVRQNLLFVDSLRHAQKDPPEDEAETVSVSNMWKGKMIIEKMY